MKETFKNCFSIKNIKNNLLILAIAMAVTKLYYSWTTVIALGIANIAMLIAFHFINKNNKEDGKT